MTHLKLVVNNCPDEPEREGEVKWQIFKSDVLEALHQREGYYPTADLCKELDCSEKALVNACHEMYMDSTLDYYCCHADAIHYETMASSEVQF